jgi:prevent-host-death family protein
MRIGIHEAKNRFAELVRIAEKGGTVVIMRHGHAVAELRPLDPKRRRAEVDPFEHLFEPVDFKLQ